MIPPIQELTPIEKWMRNTGYLLRKARLLRKLRTAGGCCAQWPARKAAVQIRNGPPFG